MRRNWIVRGGMVLVAIIVQGISSLEGATASWTNTAGGLWEAAGNWNPNATPTSVDNAQINSSGTYTVFFTNSTVDTDPGGAGSWLAMSNLTIGASSGTQTLYVDFTNTTKSLTIGGAANGGGIFLIGTTAGGVGKLVLNGGSLIATNMTRIGVGRNLTDTSVIGAKGTLIVSNGTFLTHLSSGTFTIGFANNSYGEWDIYGGTSRVLAAAGQVILGGDAAGSTGVVNVANGGLLDIAGPFRIGSPGLGRVTVSNGTIKATSLAVAFNSSAAGTNELNVLNGGTVIVDGGALTIAPGTGRAALLVNGGTLSNVNSSGVSYLGGKGLGILTVTNNGVYYSDGTVRLGGDPADFGRGLINVQGGSATFAGALQLGQFAGTGSVLVADSGVVELRSSGSLTVGSSGAFVGTVTNRAGGTLRFFANDPSITRNASGILVTTNATIEFRDVTAANLGGKITNFTYQGDNTFSLNHATNAIVSSYTFKTNNGQNFAYLNLANGGRFQATNVTVDSGGKVTGSGTLSTIAGPLDVKAGGALSPGNSFGTLTLGNGLTMQSNSLLQLEIGPVQYDQIVVLGGVSISNSILQITPTANITTGVYVIVDNDGTGDLVAGMFQGLTNNAFIDASLNGFDAFFRIQYNVGDGNNVVLFATVPEPSVGMLFILAGIACLFRHKK